ncbi:MAG TPA: HEPN domain-containing protein [Thermodesulfobacteriota bacterium]|nr:HEPN domain-containing protein [Thermodesulfobacteriota bacterium]
MNPSAKAWLKLAAADLLAAQRLQDDEDLTNISCFHSQQCVEKSLKALLESRNIAPPKTHDLVRLYGMIEEQWNIEEDMLAKLNEVYIDARYPAAIGLLSHGAPSYEETKTFYEFARALNQKVVAIIGD